MAKRIIFTGGSGKAGKHVLPYLVSAGHSVLNLDLTPHPSPQITTLKTDLTSSGEVFNALTTHFTQSEYENAYYGSSPTAPADVVIHFAAWARNLLVPDNRCFTDNVAMTYNVLEASCKLGIKKVVIASSETVYGVCFGQSNDVEYDSFPLDEDTYDVNPMDSYALSKVCGEKLARGFGRRFPEVDIYVLRIGNVIEPHEYERDFPGYLKNPEIRKRNAWSYIDARDLGQMCHLCATKIGLGFQIFNATNDSITTDETTEEILQKYCRGVKSTRSLGTTEAPLSNRKIKEVLGFKEEHDFRQYVSNKMR